MSVQTLSVEKRFILSLYEWCIQVTEKEVSRNCETLLRLKSSLAEIYIEYMAGDPNRSRLVALALVRRFHLTALKLKGEQFTMRDQQLVEDFSNFYNLKRFGAKRVTQRGRDKIDGARLSVALKEALKPVLGNARLVNNGVWKYETIIRPIRIQTYIDLGGRLPLRYSHRILIDGAAICETSLLHWHGLSRETAWDLMRRDDSKQSIDLLMEVSSRFLAWVADFCQDL